MRVSPPTLEAPLPNNVDNLRSRLASAADPTDLSEELGLFGAQPHEEPEESRISPPKSRRGELRHTFRDRFSYPVKWLGKDILERPRNLGDLVDCVQEALVNKQRVRAVGAARSHSKASYPMGVRAVSTERLKRIFGGIGRDIRGRSLVKGLTADQIVRVQAGVPIRKALRALLQQDRAFANHGSGDFQSIVGAMSTATHGSGVRFGSVAWMVRAMVVVRAQKVGSTVRPRIELIQRSVGAKGDQLPAYQVPSSGKWTAKGGLTVHAVSDDDTFFAHLVNVGSLGLVYSVTLDVIDMIKLQEHRVPQMLVPTLADLPNLNKTYRHIEINVDPYPRDGAGTPDSRKEVSASFDWNKLRCQVVKRIQTDLPEQGMRPPSMDLGRLDAAAGALGTQVRKLVQDPPDMGPKATQSMFECTSITSDGGYVDLLPEVLLLNLKYAGIGSEWAVPISKLQPALRIILGEGWTNYTAFRDSRAQWDGSGEAQTAALEALLSQHTPYYQGPTVRFVKGEDAWLAGSHKKDGAGNDVGGWAVIELGFLGSPGLESDWWPRMRHIGLRPVDDVPINEVSALLDALERKDAVDPKADDLLPAKNLTDTHGHKRRLLRLYAAYERGRLVTLHRIQQQIIELGGRPHQGLWHDLTWTQVEQCWGDAAAKWKKRFLAANPNGVFDSELTDQWAIRG